MTTQPFTMRPSRRAILRCDGETVVTGRASFVWETFLLRRGAGVPGRYEIRRADQGAPWHPLDVSVAQAEAALSANRIGGAGRVRRVRVTRRQREDRGLPVG